MSDIETPDWSEENVIKCIELFKKHQILWNPNHLCYKNKYKRVDTLNEIAREMKLPRSEIERKWKVLQSQYRRENHKYREKKKSEEAYISHWFAYKYLHFLGARNKPKKTRETCQEPQDNAHENEEIDSQTSVTAEDLDAATVANENGRRSKKIFLSPKQIKNSKTHDPRIDYAYKILKTYAEKQENRDGFTVYGEYVAYKLKSYDPFIRADVEHKINNILHEADLSVLRASNLYGHSSHEMPFQSQHLYNPSTSSYMASELGSPVPSASSACSEEEELVVNTFD